MRVGNGVFAQSGEKAWALLLELCESEQGTQGEPTPDFCRAQYELGWHYWNTGELKSSASHFQQAAQGYRELGSAWSAYALTAEGAFHAACNPVGSQDTDPGTDDFDWEYAWTGTETVEELELLQEWAYFRLNSNGGSGIDGYFSLIREIAGAYRSLDAKPSRSALSAGIQTIGLYVERQFDPQIYYHKFLLWFLEDDKTDGKEWDGTRLFSGTATPVRRP